MTARYYAECTEPRRMFECRWQKAWQVFDRDRCDPHDHNGVGAVALCVDRATAFGVRDLLNRSVEDAP